MGRMLELLKSRDTVRPTLADTKEPPRVVPEAVNEWSLRDNDEIPFIEVGPNRSIAGSSAVMAVTTRAVPVERPAETPVEASAETPVFRAISPTTPTPPARSPEPVAARPVAQPTVQPPATPPVQPPHPPTERALVTASLLEPRPISVAFEPFTGLTDGKIGNEIIAFHQPTSDVGRQYATLVEKLLQDEVGKTLLLSGLRPNVGTSTVLLNLAVAAAMKAQKRVAVIETQRQRPSLARKLGLRPLAFLQDVLNGVVSVEQALLKAPLPRLALLAASTVRPEVGLAVAGLHWLITWLKERNDLVLIDGPSLDDQTDLPQLAPLSDAMFVVMPQGESATETRGLLPIVSRIGGRLRGLLHTQIVG